MSEEQKELFGFNRFKIVRCKAQTLQGSVYDAIDNLKSNENNMIYVILKEALKKHTEVGLTRDGHKVMEDIKNEIYIQHKLTMIAQNCCDNITPLGLCVCL